MDKNRLKELADFDFYSGNKEGFYKKTKHNKAVLIQGNHWEKRPEVTILLPTYKRCALLKQALESALNQEDVTDYQIIVADNEGVSCEIETETAKLMKQYTDKRIIYYRYDRQVYGAMDNIAALAQSKWICFLHDDDILAPNHLKIMLGIIRKNENISFLSCNITSLNEEISEKNVKRFSETKQEIFVLQKAIQKGYYFFEGRANWLGALIKRENYINMGGCRM